MTTDVEREALVHVAHPARRPRQIDGIRTLEIGVSGQVVLQALQHASLLVVDDALAFPFEVLRGSARDVPLAVRVAQPLDAAALEAVMGADLLDHLTALDVVAGPRPAWDHVLRARRLPPRQWVGDVDTDVDQLVRGARARRRRFEQAIVAEPTPQGLDLRDHELGGAHPSQRLRLAKGRLRVEGGAVRDALELLATRQPRTRRMQVAIVAGQPEMWAPALPRTAGSWIPIPLRPDPEDDDASATLPAHLRLPLESASVDAVVLAGTLLHSSTHAIRRLVSESVRALRPGGGLVVVGDVVPDPERNADTRPTPLGAGAVLDLVAHATGRQTTLLDVRALQVPEHQLHRVAVVCWQYLGTAKERMAWT